MKLHNYFVIKTYLQDGDDVREGQAHPEDPLRVQLVVGCQSGIHFDQKPIRGFGTFSHPSKKKIHRINYCLTKIRS